MTLTYLLTRWMDGWMDAKKLMYVRILFLVRLAAASFWSIDSSYFRVFQIEFCLISNQEPENVIAIYVFSSLILHFGDARSWQAPRTSPCRPRMESVIFYPSFEYYMQGFKDTRHLR